MTILKVILNQIPYQQNKEVKRSIYAGINFQKLESVREWLYRHLYSKVYYMINGNGNYSWQLENN